MTPEEQAQHDRIKKAALGWQLHAERLETINAQLRRRARLALVVAIVSAVLAGGNIIMVLVTR